MNRVSTTEQRRQTLRNIRLAEASMLPPGWDEGLERQFGKTLTDPRLNPPTLFDTVGSAPKTSELPAAQPAPARRPKHARRTQRTQRTALLKWLLVAGIFAGLALTWITHP